MLGMASSMGSPVAAGGSGPAQPPCADRLAAAWLPTAWPPTAWPPPPPPSWNAGCAVGAAA